MVMTKTVRSLVSALMVTMLMGGTAMAGQTWAGQGGRQTELVQLAGGWDNTVRRVRANATDSIRVWLPAGRHRVTVMGDGDTDLDLFVYDAAGRLLAVDDDEIDYCIGSFRLALGGYVQIRVRNLGRVYNEYELTIE